MLPHKLHDQGLLAEITELVQMFDIKPDDTLHVRLGDLNNSSVCDMLAQHHAEIWRGHRARLVLVSQVEKRKGCACRHSKAVLSV